MFHPSNVYACPPDMYQVAGGKVMQGMRWDGDGCFAERIADRSVTQQSWACGMHGCLLIANVAVPSSSTMNDFTFQPLSTMCDCNQRGARKRGAGRRGRFVWSSWAYWGCHDGRTTVQFLPLCVLCFMQATNLFFFISSPGTNQKSLPQTVFKVASRSAIARAVQFVRQTNNIFREIWGVLSQF